MRKVLTLLILTFFTLNIGGPFTGTAVFFISTLVSFAGGYGNAVFLFSFTFLIGLVMMFLLRNEDYGSAKKLARQ